MRYFFVRAILQILVANFKHIKVIRIIYWMPIDLS